MRVARSSGEIALADGVVEEDVGGHDAARQRQGGGRQAQLTTRDEGRVEGPVIEGVAPHKALAPQPSMFGEGERNGVILLRSNIVRKAGNEMRVAYP
jgi:hypothetical protein